MFRIVMSSIMRRRRGLNSAIGGSCLRDGLQLSTTPNRVDRPHRDGRLAINSRIGEHRILTFGSRFVLLRHFPCRCLQSCRRRHADVSGRLPRSSRRRETYILAVGGSREGGLRRCAAIWLTRDPCSLNFGQRSGEAPFCRLFCESTWNKDPVLEWVPWGGRLGRRELTLVPAFEGWKPMAKHRTHSIEFKRQVAQEFLAGETLHGLAKRHTICRNLIRVWVQKYEAGDFDEDAAAADLLQQYEARIAALERLVGKQALELEFLKGAVKSAPRPKSVTMSVVVGPPASVLQKDAG